jgi:hypothetical protein
MRFCLPSRVALCLVFLLLVVMVTVSESLLRCNATGCSWAKDTDPRGLSRHRATCRHYRIASVLATEKRRERARESIQATQKFTPHRRQLPTQISTVSNLLHKMVNKYDVNLCRHERSRLNQYDSREIVV